MNGRPLTILLSDEAKSFIKLQPFKAQQKIYRILAFWDTEMETIVVVTHGIIKKSQKTPKKEIQKAERIRQEYFNDKE